VGEERTDGDRRSDAAMQRWRVVVVMVVANLDIARVRSLHEEKKGRGDDPVTDSETTMRWPLRASFMSAPSTRARS